MGIQINGQTDSISAIDGSLTFSTSSVQQVADINATGIITAASANFTGNVSIGGTLTYQDVTNIDSVGVITARSGINVTGGNVDIGGATHSRNLSVHDATNGVILIEGASNGTSNLMFADENDEDVGMLGYNHASNYLALTVNAAERLRITSTGKLEVYKGTSTTGKTSGSEAFTVGNGAGNHRFAVYPDGTTVIGGTGDIGNYNILLQNDGQAVFNSNIQVADSIFHVGDLNTRIRFPGNDTFSIETDGDERLHITSAGDIGLGTSSPTSFGPTLQVAGTDPALLLQDTATAVDYLGVNVASGVVNTWYDDDADFTINTASAISRTIQQVGRALVGIFGFKFANIQGLLAARTAFDRARDVAGEKAAKKLIQQEIVGIGQRATPPSVTAAETVGVQELANRYRRPLNVPIAPQGLIRR